MNFGSTSAHSPPAACQRKSFKPPLNPPRKQLPSELYHWVYALSTNLSIRESLILNPQPIKHGSGCQSSVSCPPLNSAPFPILTRKAQGLILIAKFIKESTKKTAGNRLEEAVALPI